MTCGKFEELVCDYLDATLRLDERRRIEDHAAGCPGCAEKLTDAEWTLGFLRRVPEVEPPAELVADILRETAGQAWAPAIAGGGSWIGGWVRPILRPWVEPRFAMSMAMAILSLSLITSSSQQVWQAWQDRGAGPIAVVHDAGGQLDRAWSRGVELFEIIRASYEWETSVQPSTPGAATDTPDRQGESSQTAPGER